MASSWQTSHFVVVIGAAGLAFAAGYTMGGNRTRPTEILVGNNSAAPAFPGFDGNQAGAQPPPTRRGRPDENELIAANAETEDGQPQRPPATGADRPDRETPRTGRGSEDRPRTRRDDPVEEPPPPEDPYDQGPYGPDDE
jgi:hypothetical protein